MYNNSIITIQRKGIDKGNQSIFYETVSSLYYNNSVEECLEYLLSNKYIIKSVTMDNTTIHIPIKMEYASKCNTYDYIFEIDEVELIDLGIKNALDLYLDAEKSFERIDVSSNFTDNDFVKMIDLQDIQHEKLVEIIKRVKILVYTESSDNTLLYFNDGKENYQSVEVHNEVLDQILENNEYLIGCDNYNYEGTTYGYTLQEALENFHKDMIPLAKEFISKANDAISDIENLYKKKYSEEDLIKIMKMEDK